MNFKDFWHKQISIIFSTNPTWVGRVGIEVLPPGPDKKATQVFETPRLTNRLTPYSNQDGAQAQALSIGINAETTRSPKATYLGCQGIYID